MRAVELAVYADDLCAEVAALSARAERARSRLRVAAIEREARRALASTTVAELEGRGIMGQHDEVSLRQELLELESAIDAIGELQGWVEAQLEDATSAA